MTTNERSGPDAVVLTDKPEPSETPARSSDQVRGRTLVLVVLCLAQFRCVLDDTIVNIALPSIQADLGFSGTSLQWVLNGYLLTFGGLLLLAGRASDLFVRRTVFLTGLTVFGLASLTWGPRS
ncbi:MFS transporter [Amycolatopsis speibonae]|uniref:MFS transporter n=1 Tax=Amycolatopsis speibonae TaxID=1450224 RepID=A0ABV7PA51_9PSEU